MIALRGRQHTRLAKAKAELPLISPAVLQEIICGLDRALVGRLRMASLTDLRQALHLSPEGTEERERIEEILEAKASRMAWSILSEHARKRSADSRRERASALKELLYLAPVDGGTRRGIIRRLIRVK